jgi:hypothetical protein
MAIVGHEAATGRWNARRPPADRCRTSLTAAAQVSDMTDRRVLLIGVK